MWVQKVTGAGIDGLAYSPDGAALYTIDALGRFAAWDVNTRETRPLARLQDEDRSGVYRLVVSPDGEFLVALQTGTSVACGAITDREYRLGYVPRPAATPFVPGHGSRLAVLHREYGLVGFWDIDDNHEERDAGFAWYRGEPVQSFDFVADGRTVAVLDETGEVTLADTASGEVVTRISVPKRAPYLMHVRFAPDGNMLLLFTRHQLVLWDIPRGAVRAETHAPDLFGSTFAVNPTLPVFAALNRDRVLTLYSLDTGKPLRSLDFMLGRFVRCVCFAPDGLTCAVGGSNRQFAVFDVDV